MPLISYIVIAFCLSAVAFVAAMIGIGGGVGYAPIQVIFGVDPHEAATTSLSLILMLSIGATLVYAKAGRVDFKVALVFEIFSIIGGFAGGYFSQYVPGRGIVAILIAAIFASAIAMLKRPNARPLHTFEDGRWYIWHRRVGGIAYNINILFAIPICMLAGVLSGMVGVGGGFIKVPMMAVLFGIPLDIAIATSAFMVGITALSGFSGHLVVGHWNPIMTLVFAPGVLVGSILGARTMLRIDKTKLKLIFCILMILIAIGLIIKFFAL